MPVLPSPPKAVKQRGSSGGGLARVGSLTKQLFRGKSIGNSSSAAAAAGNAKSDDFFVAQASLAAKRGIVFTPSQTSLQNITNYQSPKSSDARRFAAKQLETTSPSTPAPARLASKPLFVAAHLAHNVADSPSGIDSPLVSGSMHNSPAAALWPA
eukprot:CAMPEP_0168581928 /NCGR_PEP_ID=MMETSP0420-20121227/1691_1 /TAXON_ID=498008 /ORGANISM="Pessonella sp." /LENGTH=154 /DNA_ID=CAMNT_0008616343 /DNA_START=836 /DNA_END=1296 /DNA_ORIENTATION=-